MNEYTDEITPAGDAYDERPLPVRSSTEHVSTGVIRVSAIALIGLSGRHVTVEVAISSQLPGMTIIGLPDVALGEAKQRVRLAAISAKIALSQRKITINLSPAAIPKHGAAFDLAIALGAAAVSGEVDTSQLHTVAHVGELGLDGRVKRPYGLFPSIMAAKALGFTTAMVPHEAAEEARLVPGIRIIPVENLGQAAEWHGFLKHHRFRGEDRKTVSLACASLDTAQVVSAPCTSLSEKQHSGAVLGTSPDLMIDMAEVHGQQDAIDACVVAAAGRHHLSLTGPPGSGKTLLASRLATILPELSDDAAVAATSIRTLGESLVSRLIRRPPFETPHHTSSLVSITGGAIGGLVVPGAISRASGGVLFLDEAPEFPRSVIEALRQPLETKTIEITRSRIQIILPADFQLVVAANPCPCGYANTESVLNPCQCSPRVRILYARKLSGPLMDRIDVRCEVRRITGLAPQGEDVGKQVHSAVLRQRVTEARRCAKERLAKTPWSVNADLPGSVLRGSKFRLPRSTTNVLDRALSRGSITMRGYDRVLRMGWTVADLRGANSPTRDDIATALTLRGGY